MTCADSKLVEHFLHITHYGYWLLSKPKYHARQFIGEIWSLQQTTVKTNTLKLRAAIKHHSDLVRFLRVINPMMRNVPDMSNFCDHLSVLNLLSMPISQELLHEFCIMATKGVFLFQAPTKGLQSCKGADLLLGRHGSGPLNGSGIL